MGKKKGGKKGGGKKGSKKGDGLNQRESFLIARTSKMKIWYNGFIVMYSFIAWKSKNAITTL